MLRALFATSCASMVFGHGALTWPKARNTDVGWTKGVGWNAANQGSQNGGWLDSAGTPTVNACGAPIFLDPAKYGVQAWTVPEGQVFEAGQTIDVKVAISAAHDGYYEFRVCTPVHKQDKPTNDNKALLDCLLDPARTVLLERVTPLLPGEQANYKGTTPKWTEENLRTRWRQEPQDGVQSGTHNSYPAYSLSYRIPDNIQCDHCIFHMYWQTLNSWQSGAATGIADTTGERFWNCADVTITNPNAGGDDRGIISSSGSGSGSGSGSSSGSGSGSDGTDTTTPPPVTCATIGCDSQLTCVEGTSGSPAFCRDETQGQCKSGSYHQLANYQTAAASACSGAQFGAPASSTCCRALKTFIDFVDTNCAAPNELKLNTHQSSYCKYQCTIDGQSSVAQAMRTRNGRLRRRLFNNEAGECICSDIKSSCQARCMESTGGVAINQCWGSDPFFHCKCSNGEVLPPPSQCANVCSATCRSAQAVCDPSTSTCTVPDVPTTPSEPTFEQPGFCSPQATQPPTVEETTQAPATGGEATTQTPAAGAGISTILSKDVFDDMFKLRSTAATCAAGVQVLTYEAFVTAVDTYYPSFGAEGSLETRKREVAAFLGQISQETTGWWAGQEYAWGLCFIEEVACKNGCPQYSTAHATYPPVAGKSYHGRGAIQITHNVNYGQLSEALYGDKMVLLNEPERLTTDGVLAFRASLWFWMTAQAPKPSSHAVMVGVAPECPAYGRLNGYGQVTNIINGGLECTIATPQKVENRVQYFTRYSSLLGVSARDNLYCDNIKNYNFGACPNTPVQPTTTPMAPTVTDPVVADTTATPVVTDTDPVVADTTATPVVTGTTTVSTTTQAASTTTEAASTTTDDVLVNGSGRTVPTVLSSMAFGALVLTIA